MLCESPTLARERWRGSGGSHYRSRNAGGLAPARPPPLAFCSTRRRLHKCPRSGPARGAGHRLGAAMAASRAAIRAQPAGSRQSSTCGKRTGTGFILYLYDLSYHH